MQWVTEKYFPPGFELYDLFYPSKYVSSLLLSPSPLTPFVSSMPSAPRAHAFLSLVHHVLENKSFINDFDTPTPPLIPLHRPLALIRDPPPSALPENVDTLEELAYAREMKEVRLGIVKTVPAYLKREEQLNAREAKKVEKEKEKEKATDDSGVFFSFQRP